MQSTDTPPVTLGTVTPQGGAYSKENTGLTGVEGCSVRDRSRTLKDAPTVEVLLKLVSLKVL